MRITDILVLLSQGCSDPQATVQRHGVSPRTRRSRHTAPHDPLGSRWPLSTSSSNFRPSTRALIRTSSVALMSSSPAFTDRLLAHL
jgi:hypothetical protein